MSIKRELIDWVEDKPRFWQKTVDKLIRNNEITEENFDEIFTICKVEHGLSENEITPIDFADLRELAQNSIDSENIYLTKIHNIQNINALSTETSLEFEKDGLTVIYGDNGSGKSSFTSILKHVCNTRGFKPVITNNIYDPESQSKNKKADVEYSIDGTNLFTVKLIDETVNDYKLKSVDVFDSQSANHYIAEEDEIAFIPNGLELVEKLAIAIQKIETKLQEEKNNLDTSRIDFSILEVPENTAADQFLKNISYATTLNELREKSQLTSETSTKIVSLNEEITKLKSEDPIQILKVNNEKTARFKVLKEKLVNLKNILLEEDNTVSYFTKQNDLVGRHESLKAASENLFSGLPLKNIGSEAWKNLWESAREFYDSAQEEDKLFPNIEDNSTCPLCLQTLDSEAKIRFQNFEQFIKEDTQRKYDDSLHNINEIKKKISTCNLDFAEQQPIVQELLEIYPDFDDKLKDYLKILHNQKEKITSILNDSENLHSREAVAITWDPIAIIDKEVSKIQKKNETLTEVNNEEAVKSLTEELEELKGKQKLFDFKPKIGREIYRLKKVKKLQESISKCNTRAITSLSNTLTSKYVTQALKNKFRTELENFGFNNIQIEPQTKGVRGKQYHFLSINEENSGDAKLKDILSEGEHRCIALATFLSELEISEHNSSIIFDDPVSSLDHKWRDKIAKRIVTAANDRQVIVFTHDITFLLMLTEHSEKLNVDIYTKSLTRKKKQTGLIANNPPWDASNIKTRLGLLKNEQVILKKIENDETEEIYSASIKPLYGKLRETWERFIEEVFLNGAIQRFGREVQTQRLAKIVDLSAEDYKIVDEQMSKCSKYFWGHDTSGALIEQMPTADEFLADIIILEEFAKEIRKRRN